MCVFACVCVCVCVSVGWGEGARGTRHSGQAHPMFLVWTLSSMDGMGLAWEQFLSSCYEDAAVLC